jgi:hypothetical protein
MTDPNQPPRRFHLERLEDVSGVSGTGIVAWGVRFFDGRVALRWCAAHVPNTTTFYDSIRHVQRIHAHGGRTRIVWMD